MTIDLEAAGRLLAAVGNIAAAWVFGSARDGEVRHGSDLDLGVLFRRPAVLEELAGLRADLQRALALEEIDLVPLNGAGAVLRFQAACGRLLFCRDPQEAAAFASLAAREYEDELAAAARAWREAPGLHPKR